MIKITIIIPVYNTEKYLKRCLESIINQNFKDIEIIIINDCSSDSSLEIIKKYMNLDNRIFLINKNKNEGLSEARNSGIAKARGEYIIHIDSDDWIEQNYFLDIYTMAKKHDADMVISDFYKDFDNGKLIYKKDQYKIGKNITELTNIDSIINIFTGNGYPCVWNKLIKTKLYIENNVIHPKYISLGEDLAVIPKLLYYSKKIIKLNKPYIHYIQNKSSITKKIEVVKIMELHNVIENLKDFFKDKDLFLQFNEFELQQLFWLFDCKLNITNQEYKKLIKRFLYLFKVIDVKKLNSKKLRVIGYILKILNNKFTFLFIWIFYKIHKIILKFLLY